ncbi:putative glutamine amidotransferase [Amycolatopsis tolypomycina]|uniref:Putative glutamine amidotransferase n=1 Tax=Amycolatopsis tolypomycina TaxID=208445 RepID=A0A1H4XD57_9PSEU|nr:gamma-glutamyl-gamma-aminobutyrate hydrolase family protein [Amycolatopsis tolypomycina]SED02741.1 putative glutamine amidotransferase [Amycolatopsis tolypomycina]
MADRRPLIVVPARFSASASALRYRAEVGARALLEAVYAAGGEPLLMHPADPGEVPSRLSIADGVLLPGGGDLHPSWAGQGSHPAEYDVDVDQDAFDLAVASWALKAGRPLLAVCRGAQVVNVALGGDVVQDLPGHRHRVHLAKTAPGTLLASLTGDALEVSCFHHQGLGRLGAGLEVVAEAADGVPEAVELPSARGWFLGLQWHPEDTAATDPAQAALFAAFVAAARSQTPQCGVRCV